MRTAMLVARRRPSFEQLPAVLQLNRGPIRQEHRPLQPRQAPELFLQRLEDHVAHLLINPTGSLVRAWL